MGNNFIKAATQYISSHLFQLYTKVFVSKCYKQYSKHVFSCASVPLSGRVHVSIRKKIKTLVNTFSKNKQRS